MFTDPLRAYFTAGTCEPDAPENPSTCEPDEPDEPENPST